MVINIRQFYTCHRAMPVPQFSRCTEAAVLRAAGMLYNLLGSSSVWLGQIQAAMKQCGPNPRQLVACHPDNGSSSSSAGVALAVPSCIALASCVCTMHTLASCVCTMHVKSAAREGYATQRHGVLWLSPEYLHGMCNIPSFALGSGSSRGCCNRKSTAMAHTQISAQIGMRL